MTVKAQVHSLEEPCGNMYPCMVSLDTSDPSRQQPVTAPARSPRPTLATKKVGNSTCSDVKYLRTSCPGSPLWPPCRHHSQTFRRRAEGRGEAKRFALCWRPVCCGWQRHRGYVLLQVAADLWLFDSIMIHPSRCWVRYRSSCCLCSAP